MDIKKLTSQFIIPALLVLLGSICSAQFFVTAFNFEWTLTNFLIKIIFNCFLFSFLWYLYPNHKSAIKLVTIFYASYWFLLIPDAIMGFKMMMNTILRRYMLTSQFHFPLFNVNGSFVYIYSALSFLFLCMSYTLSYSILYKKKPILSCLIPFPILFSAFLFKIVPDWNATLGLVFFYIYFFLDYFLKHKELKPMLLSISQIAILMALILQIFPYQTQRPKALKDLRETIVAFTDHLFTNDEPSTSDISLSTLGPRHHTGEERFSYRISENYPNYYFKERTYGHYMGDEWEYIDEKEALKNYRKPIGVGDISSTYVVDIRKTKELNNGLLLLPQYPVKPLLPSVNYTPSESYIEGKDMEYSVRFSKSSYLTYPNDNYSKWVDRTYKTISPSLKNYILKKVPLDTKTMDSMTKGIVEYFDEHGDYTLNPPFYSSNDFVKEFLESDSMQGYCVHFASSAVMILRAYDIPARYVEGYKSNRPSNYPEYTSVKDYDAHAWAEYWDDRENDWKILEVTPAASSSHSPSDSQDEQENDNTQQQREPQEENTQNNNQNNQNTQTNNKEQNTTQKSGFLLNILIGISSFIACIILYFILRITIKKHRFAFETSSDERERMLKLYSLSLNLLPYHADFSSIKPLLEKTKFSNQTITKQDYFTFKQFYKEECFRIYKSMKWYQKLWFKYIKMYL